MRRWLQRRFGLIEERWTPLSDAGERDDGFTHTYSFDMTERYRRWVKIPIVGDLVILFL